MKRKNSKSGLIIGISLFSLFCIVLTFLVIKQEKTPPIPKDYDTMLADNRKTIEELIQHTNAKSPLAMKLAEMDKYSERTKFIKFNNITGKDAEKYGIDTTMKEGKIDVAVETICEVEYGHIKLVLVDYRWMFPKKKLFIVKDKAVQLKVPEGFISPELIVFGESIPPCLSIKKSQGGPGSNNTLIGIKPDGSFDVLADVGGWWAEMFFADLDGDGVDEVVTGLRETGYDGIRAGLENHLRVWKIHKWNGRTFEYKCDALELFFKRK